MSRTCVRSLTLWSRYLQEARRQLREEKSDLLRQWQETIHLLRDTATRHMRAEEACDGEAGFL